MFADGERLKFLVIGARRRVLLCAPFIKVGVLRAVLSVIRDGVPVRVVTRWKASEVASGVSDLEVFELVNDRPHTTLSLLDDLHAKLYLADDRGLAGSANLTAAALGWAERSNVELLLPVSRSDEDVARLLRRLEHAQPATYAIRSAVEADAAELHVARLAEAQDRSSERDSDWNRAWLPSCAAPGRLWTIYQDSESMAVAEGTKEDGLSDLHDLHIPGGLSRSEFEEMVRDTLLSMPAFRRVTERIPQVLTDAVGTALVHEARPELSQTDAELQWRIVRDWISEFFQDEFEVAPESFVTRLRPR